MLLLYYRARLLYFVHLRVRVRACFTVPCIACERACVLLPCHRLTRLGRLPLPPLPLPPLPLPLPPSPSRRRCLVLSFAAAVAASASAAAVAAACLPPPPPLPLLYIFVGPGEWGLRGKGSARGYAHHSMCVCLWNLSWQIRCFLYGCRSLPSSSVSMGSNTPQRIVAILTGAQAHHCAFRAFYHHHHQYTITTTATNHNHSFLHWWHHTATSKHGDTHLKLVLIDNCLVVDPMWYCYSILCSSMTG